MRKFNLSLIIAIALILILPMIALSVGLTYTVTVDGQEVTLSGSYSPGVNLSVLVVDNATSERVYIDQVQAGGNGKFSLAFSLSEAASYQVTITAADGTTLSKNFTITGGGSGGKITVSLKVVGASQTYFDGDIKLAAGASPIDALDKAGLDYTLKNGSYVSAIEGEKESSTSTAGWKYKVNGKIPSLSSKDYQLADGDTLIWFWATDYNDTDEDQGGGGGLPGEEVVPGETPPTVTFTDLAGFEWAKTAIAVLSANGVIQGTGDDLFEPKREVTRGEFIKMVLLALKVEVAASVTANPFGDVESAKWYAAYISAAKAMKIVSGSPDGNFYPDQSISRQEMTAIIIRALEALNLYQEQALPDLPFKDSAKIADWARVYVEKAYAGGLVNGVSADTFSPDSYANRAQAAVIIYRILSL